MSGHSRFVSKDCGVAMLGGPMKILLATTASVVMEALRLQVEY